jgi:hypothetical protein
VTNKNQYGIKYQGTYIACGIQLLDGSLDVDAVIVLQNDFLVVDIHIRAIDEIAVSPLGWSQRIPWIAVRAGMVASDLLWYSYLIHR